MQLTEWESHYDCVLGMKEFSHGISLTFCERRSRNRTRKGKRGTHFSSQAAQISSHECDAPVM